MSAYDKLSIYVPSSIKNRLEADARLFEIFKANSRDVNLNLFLGNVLLGYYQQYDNEIQKEVQRISSILRGKVKTTTVARDEKKETRSTVVEDIQSLAQQIVQSSNRFPETSTGKKTERLSLKPTNTTWPVIQDVLSANTDDSISNSFVSIFERFLRQPSYIREQIIHKNNYETLQRAIEKHQTIAFTHTKTRDEIHTVYPYLITTSPEELFNYLLCAEMCADGTLEARSIRLCRIAYFHTTRTDIHLPSNIKGYLDNMAKYGPAFEINDDEECCVFLTEEGHRAYSMIYYQRPLYSDITTAEGGYIYHFKCSKEHVERYFRRFDAGQAVVLKPDSLRERVINHHKGILKKYGEME